MKNLLTLSALILASSASAQFRTIAVPAFPGANNPVIGLPKVMPNPLNGSIAGTLILLPRPTLIPSVRRAPAALPPVAVPATPVRAHRENVRNPLDRVIPDIKVRLTDLRDEKKDAPKESEAGQSILDENLDSIFDGTQPTHRPGRRIDIPERGMEQELGL